MIGLGGSKAEDFAGASGGGGGELPSRQEVL